MSKITRCAIYTRKSTEEGLEQDFNSLHAQREASEAFILSQKHEGWQLVRTEYDDGGYSGGNMSRPGLVRLMQDIEAGKIDVVVVYKVDRLSRSLHDFAKMVEVFDRQSVSFVSVTQQFNTTTSMGRLTLNVLLSFAQFEREVTGERIRDKIAASKKKGMWMGGPVPLGYKVQDRTLLPNPDEIPLVQRIFERYAVLASVRALQEELNGQGIKTRSGSMFYRGMLYGMLGNPIYIGKIRHKQTIHDGMHPGIVEPDLWDAVQDLLEKNRGKPELRRRKIGSHLLLGKLCDEHGALTTSQANKSGKRYYYYISRNLRNSAGENGWRIPAYEIDQLVVHAAVGFLGDRVKLFNAFEAAEIAPANSLALLQAAEVLRHQLQLPSLLASVIAESIERVELKKDSIGLHLKLKSGDEAASICTDVPLEMKRRGVEMRMVVGDYKGKPDPSLLKAVARAHLWFNQLATGKVFSIAQIARRENIDKGYIGRLLKLAFLPPSDVEAIVAGAQPREWTVNILTKMHAK